MLANPKISPVVNLGGSFATLALTGGAANQLINPGSNARGVVLNWFHVDMTAGGSQAGVYVATSAPTGIADATKRRIAAANNGGIQLFSHVPIFLPAGLGLFVWAGAGGGNIASAGWDYL